MHRMVCCPFGRIRVFLLQAWLLESFDIGIFSLTFSRNWVCRFSLSYLFKRAEIVFSRSRNPEYINIKQQTTPVNYSCVFVFNLFPNIMCAKTLYFCRKQFLFNCKKKVLVVWMYCDVILNQFHQSKLIV